jgi:hypothetical protein
MTFALGILCDEMMPIKYRNPEVPFFVQKFDVTGQVEHVEIMQSSFAEAAINILVTKCI